MNTQICNAIRDKTFLQFTYDGLYRVVEPYCYGIATTGNELLRAFQVEGSSSSVKLEWKLFEVEKIIDLEILDESFNVIRSDFNPDEKIIIVIYCIISY